jgi:hypothetical protein
VKFGDLPNLKHNNPVGPNLIFTVAATKGYYNPPGDFYNVRFFYQGNNFYDDKILFEKFVAANVLVPITKLVPDF